jgi:PAS domain S-box-containing protein
MASEHVPKVLIVDDQSVNLDALEATLASSDCKLVRAVSASEALLHLLREEFAAIVLDVRMPDMNGFELARMIKQRSRTRHVPILFLTAHLLDDADVLQGYGAGAVDYLMKPVNPAILCSKIDVFVDLFRKTHALAEVNDKLQQEIVERQKAEQALQVANQELEGRVLERTSALARASRDVRENEERWRMAMEVAHVVAWEWHLASGKMTWSTDPETLFGFPHGSLGSEQRLFKALHPGDHEVIQSAIVAALQSETYEAEYRVVRPDGTIVWIADRGRGVAGEDGSFDRIAGISRDVTTEHNAAEEREQLLQRVGEARDEAERQSRAKEDFLATLSHELRTPMNVILGWLDILVTGKPAVNLQSALSVIQRNARLQVKLIDDLLDMNSLLAGNVRLDVVPVDVGETLRVLTEALRPIAEEKKIQINAHVEAPPIQILADGRRLGQIVSNLLHNAIKFTPKGGRVEVSVARYEGETQITVRDTGRGMSPAFLPHVFERFRQEDSSTTRDAGGLGLGLSIAKRLAEAHGGTIVANSDGPGCGATFSLRLPTMGALRILEGIRVEGKTDRLLQVSEQG